MKTQVLRVVTILSSGLLYILAMRTVGDHHDPLDMYTPSGLKEVREKRLRQLYQEKVLREYITMEGTGTLQDVPEQELLVSKQCKLCTR